MICVRWFLNGLTMKQCYLGGNGDDEITRGNGRNIKIDGDDKFKVRAGSDFETMRALPEGRKMFKEIEKAGKSVSIELYAMSKKNITAISQDKDNGFVLPNGTPNVGCETIIQYDPSLNAGKNRHNLRPLTTLFHEMAHAYCNATGTHQEHYNIITPVNGSKYTEEAKERQVVGLKVAGPKIKHPDGTITTGNPYQLTENALRTRLGLPLRERYE